jgi:23S rRNA (pseudouridine1915-N3)-methyltransferase
MILLNKPNKYMQINIIAIGKFKNNCPNKELFLDYTKRTKWKITLTEINDKISGSIQEIKKKEAELIIKKIPKNSKIILLDETGINLSSREFAKKIENFQNQSTQNLTFIIGGANGVSDEIKTLANLKISFGQMTFPHMMVRSIISEQLYRAQLIITNHPYHKD